MAQGESHQNCHRCRAEPRCARNRVVSENVPLSYLRELIEYWAYDYMHRLTTRLNAFPWFQVSIDGLYVYFLHVGSRHPEAGPLVMTHGWLSSVLELLQVIRPLTEPTDPAEPVFRRVLPTLPGYGFSAKPHRAGTGTLPIATAWHQLMTHLGYTEYDAQGGTGQRR